MFNPSSPKLCHGRLARPCLLLLTPLLLLGCRGAASDSSSDSARAQQQAKEPAYQVIRRASVPSSALITMTGQLQIVDAVDDKVVLKKTKIVPNTLVTLNPGGISFNTTVVSTTPLNRKHTYEFRLFP